MPDCIEKNDFDSARPLADSFGTAAYGGTGWSPRIRTHEQELGTLWADCGIDSEWRPPKSVLVHRLVRKMDNSPEKVNEFQFAESLDIGRAKSKVSSGP